MMQKDTTVLANNVLILRSDSAGKASAHIYKPPLDPNSIFMCGNFTIKELQEVIKAHTDFNIIQKDSNSIQEGNSVKKFFNKLFS